MRAVEITEENLEDLLAYDDLFLDYFNAFLQLPVFPQPLYYNRLTGTFVEVDKVTPGGHDVSRPASPPYGATDEERDRMLEWAREERLPLFLRTELFREFKLCKLLLRPLDDRASASRSSSTRMIRGYSRQTESYVSSLSNSADNSNAQDADFDADDADELGGGATWAHVNRSALYKYQRPGSRAFSLPAKMAYGRTHSMSGSAGIQPPADDPGEEADSREQTSYSATTSKAAAARPEPCAEPIQEEGGVSLAASPKPPASREVTFDDEKHDARGKDLSASSRRQRSSGRSRSGRSRSGRSGRRSRRSHTPGAEGNDEEPEVITDYDAAFGEVEPVAEDEEYVAFGEDVVSDAQTETDVRQLEGKHRMTLQQMKEAVIGSVCGMEQLKDFLRSTAASGTNLFNFWLDCEFYKDTMEEFDEEENMAIRNRLFRDIQDKYRLTMTSEALRHLYLTASSTGLSHTIFIRTQYNVLRRLRAYWVPRFLIHKERIDELSGQNPFFDSDLQDDAPGLGEADRSLTSTCFFPSISLVSSMPVRPEDVIAIASTTSWDLVSKGGRTLDARVKSAKNGPSSRQPGCGVVTQKTLTDKLVLALAADKAAGGPYRMFLERHENSGLLSQLLFWEDVTEYGAAEDRSADRLLRMTHAWGIFNTYVAPDAKYNIGISPLEQDEIHRKLLQNKDFVGADIFNEAKGHSVRNLEKGWIRYLKEDMKSFSDCHVRAVESPASTAEEYEVILNDRDDLLVCRPRPWIQRYPPSTESERGRRLRTALSVAESIDDARMLEIRKAARERRAMMEKERKKAVRAARQRAKEAKYAARNPNWRPGGPTAAPAPPPAGGNKASDAAAGNQPPSTEGAEAEAGERADSLADLDVVSHHSRSTRASVSKASKSQLSKSRTSKAGQFEGLDEEGEERKKKQTTFYQSRNNKQMINLFKKYLTEHEGKEFTNPLNLYLDVEAYNALPDGKGPNQKKKDIQANYIHKTFMEQGAKRKVHLSDKVYNRLRTEKDRPKTATLKEAQNYLLPQIEEAFARFFEKENDGLDGRSMANMSKAELAMRADDPGLLNAWKKGKKGSGKVDGRAQPTKADKDELLTQLKLAAAGDWPTPVKFFWKYLASHAEEDGMPLVPNDLWFWLEVEKFRNCSHADADDEMLKRKVTSILECFLDSSAPPALQVDISTETQQKCIRGAQKYLQGKEISAAIFDDAFYAVFKELLPYWAGFQRKFDPQVETSKDPLSDAVTKPQKARIARLEEMKTWRPPPLRTFALPTVPRGATVQAFTFSLVDGPKWRDRANDNEQSFPTEDTNLSTQRGGKRDRASTMSEMSVRSTVRA